MESNPHFVITMTSLKDNGSESKCLVGKPQNNRRREHHSRRMANRDLQTCKARKWGQSQLAKGQRGYQFHACRPLHGVPLMHGTATCHARILLLTRKDQMQACPHCKKTLGASHVNTQFGASGMLVNTRGRLRKVNCNFNALTPAGAVGEHSCAKRREY